MLAFNRETLVNESGEDIKYDTYHLKKRIRGEKHDNRLDVEYDPANREQYVRLNMSIHIEGFSSCEDLILYYKLMLKRKGILENKIKNIKLRFLGYKQKVLKMIAPFESVLAINDSNLEFVVHSPKKKGCSPICSTF